MQFSEVIKNRISTRTFSETNVERGVVREILELAQEAPSSCNLQLTQAIVIDDPALLKELSKSADRKFSWAPCMILLTFDPRLNRGRWATQISLGGVMQTILLAATERGLTSCPMAGFRGDSVIKKVLGIPGYLELGLLIALGYPKENISTASRDRSRLPFSSFASWNGREDLTDLPISMDVDDWSPVQIRAYRERIAPVYLYPGRNRLGSFAPSIIAAAIQKLEKHLVWSSHAALLDLCTYEGEALSLLYKSHPEKTFFFSDSLAYIGVVQKEVFPNAQFVSINVDARKELPIESGSIDLVTCVHKIEFTPNWRELIAESARMLRPGGAFFLTTMQPPVWRRLFDMVRWYFSIDGTTNVYDGNPFYKIGPFSYRSMKEIRRICKNVGLECSSYGKETVSGGGKLSHTYAWMLFTKK
jgi:nitroreductase/ubiquinone/menaquinone biosynthesis C-methylase UbiE